MAIAKSLMEISEYAGEGYMPLIDFQRLASCHAQLHRRTVAGTPGYHAAPR